MRRIELWRRRTRLLAVILLDFTHKYFEMQGFWGFFLGFACRISFSGLIFGLTFWICFPGLFIGLTFWIYFGVLLSGLVFLNLLSGLVF